MLKLPNIDVGGSWIIFGLPPAEIAEHPLDKIDIHELYFIIYDIESFITAMRSAILLAVRCRPEAGDANTVDSARWR